MANEKHNLESLFRKQLEASEPAYDPAYWDQAQQTILRLERAKRRKRWLLGILLVLLLLTGATGVWFASRETPPVQEANAVTTPDARSRAQQEAGAKPLEPSTKDLQKRKSPQNSLSEDHPKQSGTQGSAAVRDLQPRTLAAISQATESAGKTSFHLAEIVREPRALDHRDPAWATFATIQRIRPLSAQFPTRSGVSYASGPARFAPRFAWHPFAGAGLGANAGFGSPGERSWHYAPYLAVGVRRNLSRNLGLSLGLSYETFTGINRTKTRTETELGFIGQQTRQTLHHNQSRWLSLPINLEYHLFSGLYAVGGAKPAYLIQTRGLLETVTQDDLGNKTESLITARQYMDGLNRWDLQMQAGLVFRLNGRFEVRALASQGLRSRTDAAVLEGGGNDRGRTLQLGFRWYW